MRWLGKYGWAADRGVSVGVPLVVLPGVRALVPGAAAQGPARRPARASDRATMDEIAILMHGFARRADAAEPACFMLVGIMLGVLIGVLPGLGGANGVAILLPLTFSMTADLGDHHAVAASTGARCSAARSPRSCSTSRASPGRWRPPSTAIRWRSRAGPAQALTAAFTSSFVGALFAVHA